MNRQISIYTENIAEIDFFLKDKRDADIQLFLKPICDMPSIFNKTVTFLIVENQETLESLNTEQVGLLIVIIPSTLSVKKDNKLSDAIVYRRKSDESNQAAMQNMLLSLALPYIDSHIYLELIDLTNSLSFNGTGYLEIYKLAVDELLSSHEQFFSQAKIRQMQQSPAVILSILVDLKCLTLARLREVTTIISKKLGDDYLGDIFYQSSQKQLNVVEEVYVLYSSSSE